MGQDIIKTPIDNEVTRSDNEILGSEDDFFPEPRCNCQLKT